jgi:hypothetical protein
MLTGFSIPIKVVQTIAKQGCDKKTYQTLVLNILKIIEGRTFIYTPWGPNSRKLPWKFYSHVWSMRTHVAHD